MSNRRRALLLGVLFSSGFTCLAQSISFTPAPNSPTSIFTTSAVVNDINQDGWVEPLGTLNDKSGNLTPLTVEQMGLLDLFVPGRPNDVRVADFNGDGCPDLVAEGYTSTNVDSRAELYFGDCTGHFQEDPDFAALNLRGRGEGLVVADFNNDGYLDILLPYYTFEPCGDPLCPNSPQVYLLLNDGHGHFHDVAQTAGVTFSAEPGVSPEGVQVADLDNNGLLDVYIGGHLMLNQSVDALGIPHFVDCNCGLPPVPLVEFLGAGNTADEGFKFLDWNNDGLLDLVIQNWGTGAPPPYGPPPPPGPTLYQNTGTATKPQFTPQATTTDGTGHPFFSAGPPAYFLVPFVESDGVNAYDMDNDGLEDIITAGSDGGSPDYPPAIFRNTGSGYELVPNAVPGMTYGLTGFGDFNRDGKIDLAYASAGAGNTLYLVNNSPTPANRFISVEVLGPNGEQNQYGRMVQIQPVGVANVTYTRLVDSGSGYHTESQYPILVGTPYSGVHRVTAFFPGDEQGTVSVTVNASPGQYIKILAPPSLGLQMSPGNSSASQVKAGSTATYKFEIGGHALSGTADLSCAGAPSGYVCTLPPTILVSAKTTSTFSVVVSTDPGAATLTGPQYHVLCCAWAVGVLGWIGLPRAFRRKRLSSTFLPLILLLLLCSCGGGNSGGGGTYTLTIKASVGSATQSKNITLTVD